MFVEKTKTYQQTEFERLAPLAKLSLVPCSGAIQEAVCPGAGDMHGAEPVLESQNPRLIWVERTLKVHPAPSPAPDSFHH